MTDIEVTQKLNVLKNTFANGRYWNHDPNDLASAEDINNGINHPDSVRDIPCTHHPAGSNCNTGLKGQCGCNCFKSSIQCAGFAFYMAFRVFGTYPMLPTRNADYNGVTDDNGWIYYTYGNAVGVKLAPGDIIRRDGHSAIVHTVDRNSATGSATVSLAEVWGGVGCKINWGGFNNSITDEATLTAAGDNFEYIIKAPKSSSGGNVPIKYTVKFYRNYSESDTEQLDTKELEAGKSYRDNGVTFYIPPDREDFVFAGWYTDREGGTQHTLDTIVPAVDYPLYAQWIRKTIVRFMRNYSDSDTVQSDKLYLVPGKRYRDHDGVSLITPTREDYRFDGWFTEKVGGIQHTLDTVIASEDYFLYAHWTRVYVNISYYRNHSDSDTTVYVKKHNAGTVYGDSLLTLNSLDGWIRSHYNFDGWYTNRVGGTQITADSAIGNDDASLYAHWKQVGLVHYMRNYTTDDDREITRLGCVGDPLTIMANFDGYTTNDAYYAFAGWYTSRSGGVEYTKDSLFPNTTDLYLYAHWARCTKIYYMRNQSEDDEACEDWLHTSGSLFSPKYTYDDYETSDAYYKFSGWYTAKVGGTAYTEDSYVPYQKELYLYARWVRYTKVTYNPVLYFRQPYEVSYPTGLPFGSMSSLHETGYRFNGWYTSWEGGTKYTAQTIVPNVKNLTLYAQWSRVITVYFHNNYSDATPHSMPCYENEPYGDYVDSYHPTREGCDFKGWYTSPNYDEGELVTSSSIVPEDSPVAIHLYAHWTVDVVYNPCGGCMLGKSLYTYDVGGIFGRLPEVCCCEEEKYFDGWYTLPNGKGQKINILTTVPDYGMTLYANWRPEL